MKRLWVMMIMVLCFTVMVTGALATESMLTGKVSGLTVAKDKNGAEYVRWLVNESRTLDGIVYSISLPVMAFGAEAKEAKALKNGDNFKVISQKRYFENRESYTVIKFVK